ncbi:hypothetical protein ABNF97_17105 [Plantactinospora sp. B6F1]|uniref:hypothetical protein n=1 Tax=Plantactinospora sp. B6F1 TaxID=3158971 RepID=UPI0032D92040
MTTPVGSTKPNRTKPNRAEPNRAVTSRTEPAAGGAVPPSTTRGTLLRLLGCLLGATVLVLASSLAVIWGTHRSAETVRTRSVPAVMELAAVRTALVRADTAAITSFQTRQSGLVGPGEEYQNQIAVASQGLAQAAEDIGSEGGSSGQIQVVEGLLVAYVGLMGQAHAHYRQSGPGGLATAYAWYASRLLHSDDGILAQLDTLLAAETEALEARLSSGWLSPGTTLLWVLPVLLLLCLLVGAQRYLRRRFRRTVNWGLAAATVLLVVLTAGTSFVLVSKEQLADAHAELSEVRRLSAEQSAGADHQGIAALDELLAGFCSRADGCAVSSDVFRGGLEAGAPAPAVSAPPVADREVLSRAGEVDDQAALATGATSGAFVVLLLASPIALLVWLGLRPRIEEYRYRSR